MDLDAECWRPVDPTLRDADIVLQVSWRWRHAPAGQTGVDTLPHPDPAAGLLTDGTCAFHMRPARALSGACTFE